MSATHSTEQHRMPNLTTRSHFWLKKKKKILWKFEIRWSFQYTKCFTSYTFSSLYSMSVAGITKNIKANALTAGCQTDKTVQIAVMIAIPALNLFLKICKT